MYVRRNGGEIPEGRNIRTPDFGSGEASSGIYGSGEAGAEDETDFFKLETI